MAHPGLAPRRAAVALLDAVLEDGRLLAEVSGAKGPMGRLAPEEKARAQRLALSTLRAMDRADRLLGPHLRKKPPLHVHNVLRLSVVEICADGAADHGVVNTAVELAREGRKSSHFTGLVNAVLRKIAQDGAEKWNNLPVPRLPKWLRKPLIADYGKSTVEAMEAAHFAGAPLDLTAKSDSAAVAKMLGAEMLPGGSLRLQHAGQVSALAGYATGDWWVQDVAAALPVKLLAPRRGERVLDLCAAPGGKTMQMAAAGAEVTALDLSQKRMARVAENLLRTGLKAQTVVGDALKFRAAAFDAVLLDAPCTATGTIRRHPDLPYAKDGSDFPALFALQENMIDHAVSLLKPGGRLVFCTCSLLPDEGEIQIEDALKRLPGLKIDTAALDHSWIEDGWRSPEGGLRLRPDFWAARGGMDGFYMAALRRE